MHAKALNNISLKRKVDQTYNLDRLMETELFYSLNEILLNHALLVEHYEEESLHQMRVNLRRMISFLHFFKPELPKQEWESVRNIIRALLKPTSKVRDFDVVASSYILPACNKNGASLEFRNLLNESQDKLANLHEQLSNELSSADYLDLLTQLKTWVRNSRWKSDSLSRHIIEGKEFRKLIEKKLGHYAQDLRNKIKKAKKFDRKQLHKLRVEVKELRYMLDILKLSLKNQKRQTKYLKELQELLGDINDSYIAENIIEDINAADYQDTSRKFFQSQAKQQRLQQLKQLQRKF